MNKKNKKQKPPHLKTDKQAEEFVATSDLAQYDLTDFQPVKFEIQKKSVNSN